MPHAKLVRVVERPALGRQPEPHPLDVLGRRTVLRILWELQSGPMSFRTLQEACATNSAHLNARLRELRDLDLVELVEDG